MTAREPGQIAPAELGLDGYGELRLLDDRGIGSLFETHDLVHDRPILLRVGVGPDALDLRSAFDEWCQVGGHPNVVTAFNLNGNGDGTVVAIELECSAESLEARLQLSGPLPFVEVLALGASIAGALAELGRHDIVHGAVRADTVMLAADGRPQLTDIGLHTATGTTAEQDVRALGRLLASALGVPAATDPSDAALTAAKLSWSESVEVPDLVRRELDAVIDGAVTDAAVLRTRLTDLHVHYTGRKPDSLGTINRWTGGPHLGAPATPLGSMTEDPSRSTVTHHRGRVAEPSGSWLESHSDVNASWFDDDPPALDAVDEHDRPQAAPAGRWRLLVSMAVVCAALVAGIALWAGRADEPAVSTTTTTSRVSTTDPTVVAPPPRPVPPAAATDVAALYIGQHSVRLSWTDNASVDEGYLVRVQRFRLDSVTGRTVGGPISSGWIDRALREGATPGDLLPTGTTEVELALAGARGPDVLTCLKPVAVTRGREPVESVGEPLCLPAAAPNAPTHDLRRTQPHPGGVLRLTWSDTSFDEDTFVVAEIGPGDDVIAHWRTTEPRLDAIELGPGSRRCFVIKAENARNHTDPPALLEDGSVSDPFCFEVSGGTP